MKLIPQNKLVIFWSSLFLITMLPFLTGLLESDESINITDETFTRDLGRLNSIDKMIAYTDSVYASENLSVMDTQLYVSKLSTLMRNRFFLKPLNYSMSENWIAWLCGKLLWSHFASPVLPNDIIKHSYGLCSQQTIVFMELLRRKGITTRSLGLGYDEGPGHFLCEVHFGGAWHLHDVSVEPVWTRLVADHRSFAYYLQHMDSLFIAYESRLPKEVFFKITQKHRFGEVNQMPARKMAFFQRFTYFLTWFIPALSLFMAIRTYRKQKSVQFNHPSEEERTPGAVGAQVLDKSFKHI